VVGDWDVGDVPIFEHRRHYETCPFVQGVDVGNIPVNVAGADDAFEQDIKTISEGIHVRSQDVDVEEISDIFLKELKGGIMRLSGCKSDTRIPRDVYQICIDKKDPLMLENGVMLDRIASSSFGPLKKKWKCLYDNHYDYNCIVYETLYTMTGLRVVIKAIILADDLESQKAGLTVADSWSVRVSRVVAEHFDKLLLNKLNELAWNK
jgi:hypothetical protein